MKNQYVSHDMRYIDHDGRHEAQLVTAGVNDPAPNTYSIYCSVVLLRSLCLVEFLDELNDLEVLRGTDVRN